jgi:tetratricopeptide (TPR) repeat protein
MAGFFRRWLLRPSLWTCIVAILAYCDDKPLRGSWVYDDAGSVKKNVVVSGQVPLREVVNRDFWGTPMSQSQSHKSFRPVTTLTFRWNQVLAERLGLSLSLFSKEQGATTLISLVIYDFLQNHGSVLNYLKTLFARDAASIAFLRRTIILAIQTLLVCGLRYWLNGETSPDFIQDQNPAGFAEDRSTRVFSVGWVYCLYIWDALYPRHLCPDWSGISIPLIEHWQQDKRSVGVVGLWMFAAACLGSLIEGAPKNASHRFKEGRRIVLVAFFAFMCSPFLLSSNLLIVVGLMKADRVIYLPLLGFCILEALFIKTIFSSSQAPKIIYKWRNHEHVTSTGSKLSSPGHLLVMIQLVLFAGKVHERNVAWSDPMSLWASAYQVNPISRHTIYNCGYELSLRKRYEEAEEVLRPIGSPQVEGPSNTFVYAMVLFNLNRCDEANQYLDEAFEVLEEKKAEGGTRYTPSSVARIGSNLLVARAYCAPDIAQTGHIMYSAVEKDPTNEYALQQAMAILQKVETSKTMQQNRIGMGRQ